MGLKNNCPKQPMQRLHQVNCFRIPHLQPGKYASRADNSMQTLSALKSWITLRMSVPWNMQLYEKENWKG